MMGSCLRNGGQRNWLVSSTSHVRRSCTGFIKESSGPANSMNPCTAGSCGLMKRSRNDFGRIISARLGTICATAGRILPLLNTLDEEIIPVHDERRTLWQTSRTRKTHLGVVWLGHGTDQCLDYEPSSALSRF